MNFSGGGARSDTHNEILAKGSTLFKDSGLGLTSTLVSNQLTFEVVHCHQLDGTIGLLHQSPTFKLKQMGILP